MVTKATAKLTATGSEWTEQWLSAVAEGRSTMSQRKLASIETRGGGIKLVKAIANELHVHLVQLTDDKGNVLVAASKHRFKVIA